LCCLSFYLGHLSGYGGYSLQFWFAFL
jgi:hypothetical protein